MTQQLYIITFPIRHPLGLQAFAFLFSSFAFRCLSLVGLVGCPFRFGCRGSWSFWAVLGVWCGFGVCGLAAGSWVVFVRRFGVVSSFSSWFFPFSLLFFCFSVFVAGRSGRLSFSFWLS